MAQQKREKLTPLNAEKIANTIRSSKEWINILGASFSPSEFLKQINASDFLDNLCLELAREHKVDFSNVSVEIILLPALRGVMGRINSARTSQEEVSTLAAVIAGMDGIFVRMRDVMKETHSIDFSSIEKDSILKYCTIVSLQQASLGQPKVYSPGQDYESKDIYYMEKGQELANELEGIRRFLNALRERLVSEHDVDLKKLENILSENGSQLTKELYQEMNEKVLAIHSEGSSKPNYKEHAQELAKKYSKLYQQRYPCSSSQSIPRIAAITPLKVEPDVEVELAHELTIRTPDINEQFEFEPCGNTHYVFNTFNAGVKDHIAHSISEAKKINDGLSIARQELSKESVNKQGLIQNIFHQALQEALKNKNGRLFLEPVGLEFDEVDAQWYADMVAEEIFSLDTKQREQLEISFAILPGEKNKLFDNKVRDHLMKYRLQQWALEALGYDAENEINSQTMKAAVDTLLEILKRPRLGDLRDKLIQCRSMVPINPSNLQKRNYLDLKKELFDIFRNLFKTGVLESVEGITFLSDRHDEALSKAAIQTKLTVIKSQQSWDGIRDKMSKGQYIALNTELQTEEISSALCQLALDNPDKTNELLDVLVCTKGNIQDALLRVNEDQRYPRHVIINNARNQYNTSLGGHWTRLKIEKIQQEIEEEVDGKLAKKLVEKTVFTYYDSLVRQRVDTSFLGQDEILQNLFGPLIEKKGISTGHQPSDGWTCGYHSIAGVARELEIADIPNCDLGKDNKNRTRTLVNWGYKLFAGKTYDEYSRDAKPAPQLLNHGFEQQPEPDPKVVINSTFKLSHLIGQQSNIIQMLNTLFSIGLSSEQQKALASKVGDLNEGMKKIHELTEMFTSLPEHVKILINLDQILTAIEVDLPALLVSYDSLKKNDGYAKLAEVYSASLPQEEVIQDSQSKIQTKEKPLPPWSDLMDSARFFHEMNKKHLIVNRHESVELQREYDKRFGLIPV